MSILGKLCLKYKTNLHYTYVIAMFIQFIRSNYYHGSQSHDNDYILKSTFFLVTKILFFWGFANQGVTVRLSTKNVENDAKKRKSNCLGEINY